MKSHTPNRRTASSAQKSKQPGDAQNLPTQGDGSLEEEAPYEDDFKDLYYPNFLGVLKESAICLFPGKKVKLPQDRATFLDCLPWLATCNCDTLLFCEMNLTKARSLTYVARQTDTQRGRVKILRVTPIDSDFALAASPDETFIGCAHSPPDWIPDSAKPRLRMFWGHRSRLEIEIRGQEPRTISLLHVGIGGHAVWLYFLNPHALKVTRIIIDPRGDSTEHGGLGQPEPPADKPPEKPC